MPSESSTRLCATCLLQNSQNSCRCSPMQLWTGMPTIHSYAALSGLKRDFESCVLSRLARFHYPFLNICQVLMTIMSAWLTSENDRPAAPDFWCRQVPEAASCKQWEIPALAHRILQPVHGQAWTGDAARSGALQPDSASHCAVITECWFRAF